MAHEVHKRLAAVLGIDLDKVTGFDVHAHRGEAVRVVVHRLITKPANLLGEIDSREFRLELLPPAGEGLADDRA